MQLDSSKVYSSCEICKEPFIYGWVNPDGKLVHNEDADNKQKNGQWTHDRCYKG